MEHSMNIFARLVRLLLGETAIAQQKLECGHELVILGVQAALPLIMRVVRMCFLRPRLLRRFRRTRMESSLPCAQKKP